MKSKVRSGNSSPRLKTDGFSCHKGYKNVLRNGLWDNNQALVALLGLCPLLAVSNTLINGLGLGVATTIILCVSNLTVSFIRHWLRPEIRLPIFVLVIASFVTTVDLLMQAYFYELYQVLGLFVPLIVTNCAIIGRAEAFASRNPPWPSLLDGIANGLGFTAVLVILGAMRELLGRGTLLTQADLLFGAVGAKWEIALFGDYPGFLLAVLPPGAFFGLGFLLALKNFLGRRTRVAKSVLLAEKANK